MGKARGRAYASAVDRRVREEEAISAGREVGSSSLRRVRGLLGSILGALALLWMFAPAILDRQQNAVTPRRPYVPSAHAVELGQRLHLVDLHADSLLWGRDLLKRNRRGH